jgi:hypothetical protein
VDYQVKKLNHRSDVLVCLPLRTKASKQRGYCIIRKVIQELRHGSDLLPARRAPRHNYFSALGFVFINRNGETIPIVPPNLSLDRYD